MNESPIEWCDYTWNPITGCFHSCRRTYCYNTMKSTAPMNRFGVRYKTPSGSFAREKNWRGRETGGIHIAQQGEIYPYGYDPTFYPHRLKEPFKVKKPVKIFTVDTGDMFGKWVKKDWIEQILNVAGQCSWHTFQLLTKNPDRLLEFEYPDNAWVGTSVNSDADIAKAKTLRKVKASVLYLSIEPLLGEITFDLKGTNWIIIGAQTGGNPVKPKTEHIERLLKQTEALGIPIFMKHNIKQYYPHDLIQQYPS